MLFRIPALYHKYQKPFFLFKSNFRVLFDIVNQVFSPGPTVFLVSLKINKNYQGLLDIPFTTSFFISFPPHSWFFFLAASMQVICSVVQNTQLFSDIILTSLFLKFNCVVAPCLLDILNLFLLLNHLSSVPPSHCCWKYLLWQSNLIFLKNKTILGLFYSFFAAPELLLLQRDINT